MSRATVQDLYNVPENGKAELVKGELLHMSPTGYRPGRASTRIASSLLQHEDQHGGGYAVGDNGGFVVALPDRESFSPDAAWLADNASDMRFVQGAPLLAVEIRSENDYGPAAERAILQKIQDYFAAGTLVVWDVDLQSADVIKNYAADAPDTPRIFRRGDMADAEPAVVGWRFEVAKLFRP